MSEDQKEKAKLREYEITLKRGAPAKVVAEVGFCERWKAAREAGDEYLDIPSGAILTDAILKINDVTLSSAQYKQLLIQQKQMAERPSGIVVPESTSILDKMTN